MIPQGAQERGQWQLKNNLKLFLSTGAISNGSAASWRQNKHAFTPTGSAVRQIAYGDCSKLSSPHKHPYAQLEVHRMDVMRSLFFAGCLGFLCGCGVTNSEATARATAVAGGCWPYGTPQPFRTAIPAQIIYPTCAPAPGVPTITLAPTDTPTPIPPATPLPIESAGGWMSIADAPGEVIPWARWAKTPRLAVHPFRGTATIAWVSWANGVDTGQGDVWVRTQSPSGSWGLAQTLNTAPVSHYFGGLGLTVSISDVTTIIYGAGGAAGDLSLYLVEQLGLDAEWSAPTRLPISGRVIDLVADSQGGLHLLVIGPNPHDGDAIYAYRPPAATAWQTYADLPGPAPEQASFTLLERPDGTIRCFALLKRASQIVIVSSDDGHTWRSQQLDTNRYLPDESIVATSLVAAARPAGDLVAAAWSQIPGPGNARGGVYGAISLDGGASWRQEEQIAQHETDGRIFDEDGHGLRAGFEPSLVYDAGTDMLVCSWVEDDLALRGTQYGAHIRSLASARTLTDAQRWIAARTPDNHESTIIPELAPWGMRGWLFSDRWGRHHWLLVVESRNSQQQLLAKPVVPAFYFVAGES